MLKQEEKKKHKGKTPSFGNTNAPLFLNNFQIDPNEIISDNTTPLSHKEDTKSDRRTYMHPSTEITEKFSAPILSHREQKKSGGRKPVRGSVKNRQHSKKASPLTGISSAGSFTPKPVSQSKILF
jgi:hypothetical protein